MIVVDTNVLSYAAGGPHPWRDPCRSLLEAIADGPLEATTTAEVIQEFAHVRARRRSREDAVALAARYTAAFSPLLSVSPAILLEGLEIFRGVARLGAFDSVLAAAARAAGADALVSTDKAFSAVPGLRHLLPTDSELQALTSS